MCIALTTTTGSPRASARKAGRSPGPIGSLVRPSSPAGRLRGVSLLYSGWNTYLAQVAEVEVSKAGEVRVHRIVCAVDCGTIVNPDIVKAQIEGGVVFGISGALWGEITLKNGRVEQSNFNNYRTLRMNETPGN